MPPIVKNSMDAKSSLSGCILFDTSDLISVILRSVLLFFEITTKSENRSKSSIPRVSRATRRVFVSEPGRKALTFPSIKTRTTPALVKSWESCLQLPFASSVTSGVLSLKLDARLTSSSKLFKVRGRVLVDTISSARICKNSLSNR